jgi:hypothetical protein
VPGVYFCSRGCARVPVARLVPPCWTGCLPVAQALAAMRRSVLDLVWPDWSRSLRNARDQMCVCLFVWREMENPPSVIRELQAMLPQLVRQLCSDLMAAIPQADFSPLPLSSRV